MQYIAAVREWRRVIGAYVTFPPPLNAALTSRYLPGRVMTSG
jgi:hypothetical protein